MFIAGTFIICTGLVCATILVYKLIEDDKL